MRDSSIITGYGAVEWVAGAPVWRSAQLDAGRIIYDAPNDVYWFGDNTHFYQFVPVPGILADEQAISAATVWTAANTTIAASPTKNFFTTPATAAFQVTTMTLTDRVSYQLQFDSVLTATFTSNRPLMANTQFNCLFELIGPTTTPLSLTFEQVAAYYTTNGVNYTATIVVPFVSFVSPAETGVFTGRMTVSTSSSYVNIGAVATLQNRNFTFIPRRSTLMHI